ncbi:MAG: carboxypeptidase M32 [Candidatus Protochlamydia sp.]|nr:carboxypeptidase M32 [Candidatus Protochlamydia sp.]
MKKMQKNYDNLHQLSKQTRILEGVVSLLDWDQETYMPSGAAPIRAEQLKTMAGVIHREKTSKKFGSVLSKLVDIPTGTLTSDTLSPPQAAAVKEWRRDYLHAIALPAGFVEEYAQLTSQAMTVWKNAKKTGAFQQFAPFLDRIVSMCRKKADLLGYEEHPYDALLDQFEPDMKTSQVAKVFENLRSELTPFVKKIIQHPIDDHFLFGKWDGEKQIEFCRKILDKMGYSGEHGRIDFSAHPFSSSSHPTDSRITTRLHPDSLISNIFVILHEGGHALYEMGLPQENYGTPLGDARSLGVHESQSRWWETRIGSSKAFWHYFLPELKSTFEGRLDHITLDQFYRAINKVKPSLIRVEADEVTYPFHVILRFELEKGLIEGSLNVRDIPEAWNAKMKEYLGVEPKNNSEGCLQDVHWSCGTFGYFPTYSLGNLYAAHLFEAFEESHHDWKEKVSLGELQFIKEWLKEKIYQHGRRYTTQELLKLATGQPFSAEAYIRYIKNKYSEIYA